MSTRYLFVLLVMLLSSPVLLAQSSLDGTWEGTMTIGGIYSNEELPMQLYLNTKDGIVEGRSYVQLPEGGTLRMDLRGKIFTDRSIRLVETAFAGDEFNERLPKFNRKYQIIFRNDIWNPELIGYWQEVKEEVFSPNRRRGRMSLTKRKTKGV